MSIARIGLIGDIHAEDQRLALTLRHLIDAEVDAMICTGDLVDGIGDADLCIQQLIDHDVYCVRGNHDRWVLQNKARHIPNAHLRTDLSDTSIAYLEALPTQITLQTEAGSLLLCHGIADNDLRKIWPGTERMPVERCNQLDEIVATGEHRFLVNGHMHFRTLIHFPEMVLINAGTLTGKHWPGFSILDVSASEISAYEFIETGDVRISKVEPLFGPQYETFADTQAFQGGWEPVRLF